MASDLRLHHKIISLEQSDITVMLESPKWEVNIPKIHDTILQLLQETLHVLEQEKQRIPFFGGITYLFTDDAQIQELNNQFRHKNKPTNVLSFPTHSLEELDDMMSRPTITSVSGTSQDLSRPPLMLGDVALAFETIMRESTEQNKPFRDHLSHLMLHGTLHLLGYDHEEEDERALMESLEITILKNLHIDNPYEER